MARIDPIELRDAARRSLANLLTLADIGNTAQRLWQIVFSSTDTDRAEVYGPLGYAARPAARGAKAVVIRPGNGTISLVTAFQDPGARDLGLAEDDRAVFNDAAEIIVTAAGKVIIRAADGTAVPLATKADVQSLRDYVATLTLPVAGATAGPPTVPPGQPSGTAVLEAE